MSIWNTIKPAKKSVSATSVTLSADGRTLSLGWSDGSTSTLGARFLRQSCPCAECVEEWSGKRVLDVDAVPEEMKIVELAPVGNYALAFTFGDLHRTGIFQWDSLRSLSGLGS